MLLTGCAMRFHIETAEDVRLHTSAAGASASSPKRIVFYHDAFDHAIKNNHIDARLNHARDQDLGSTHHGLFLWTSRSGLYFYLRVPGSAFGVSVYEAVKAGKIRHICACSDWTESHDDGDRIIIRRANLQSISLLIAAPAHQPQTWIAVACPDTEARIEGETADAQRAGLWALNPAVPVEQTLQPPETAA